MIGDFGHQKIGDVHIDAGKRCGMTKSDFLDDWFVSYSPRNSNNNAEGPWCHWVHLARLILAHPLTAEQMPEHHSEYEGPSIYSEHHPDCSEVEAS